MNAISTFFVSIFIGLASLFGFQQTSPTPTDNLGAAVLPIAGSTYNLSGAGVSSSATSITLASLTIPQTGQKIQDSDLSSTFYITLEPGNRTRQELVSCTTVTQGATTATLSGCSRGLSPITPYTSSSTLQFAHGGGSQVIFSDPPQLFNEFASKADDNTFLGVNRFNSYLPETSISATTSNQLVNKATLDATANQGAATSTETNGGIVELGTLAEQAASTDGGASKPLVLQTKNATSTCQVVGSYAVIASTTTGKIDKNCIDQTLNYSWSGTSLHTASTTHTATTTITASSATNNALILNGIAYSFPATQGASSTALMTNGSGSLSFSNGYSKYAYTTTTAFPANQSASTTILSLLIPANTLKTTNALYCKFNGNAAVYTQTTHHLLIDMSYGGTASTTVDYTQSSGSSKGGEFEIYLIGAGATNSQQLGYGSPQWNGSVSKNTATLSTDSTLDKYFYVVAKERDGNPNSGINPDSILCQFIM